MGRGVGDHALHGHLLDRRVSKVATLLPSSVPGFVCAQFVKTFENHPWPLFGSWKQLNLTSSSLLRLNSAIYSRGVTAPCCSKLVALKKLHMHFYEAVMNIVKRL